MGRCSAISYSDSHDDHGQETRHMAAHKPDMDSQWKEALEQYFPAFL